MSFSSSWGWKLKFELLQALDPREVRFLDSGVDGVVHPSNHLLLQHAVEVFLVAQLGLGSLQGHLRVAGGHHRQGQQLAEGADVFLKATVVDVRLYVLVHSWYSLRSRLIGGVGIRMCGISTAAKGFTSVGFELRMTPWRKEAEKQR